MWELDHNKGRVPQKWCFWICCWRRLLRVPWTARSNQSILKEINPEYSLEGLMLKLKLQYFAHLPDRRTDLSGKDPDAGKDWGQSEKSAPEDEMVGWHHQLNRHELEQTQDTVKDREAWCAAVHGVAELDMLFSGMTEQQQLVLGMAGQSHFKRPQRNF